VKFDALQRRAEDPFLLGLSAGGELWIYGEGRASKRRVPCFRGRDGTSLLGPLAGGELSIYEEGGDNELPARAAAGVTRRSLGIITSPDLGGGDSKRRAPCPRGRDGTSLLGLRADGEL